MLSINVHEFLSNLVGKVILGNRLLASIFETFVSYIMSAKFGMNIFHCCAYNTNIVQIRTWWTHKKGAIMKTMRWCNKSCATSNKHICTTRPRLFNMVTASNVNIFLIIVPFVRGIHRSPVGSPHKGQRRRALMFSLICNWTDGWANDRQAGDLRRYRDF